MRAIARRVVRLEGRLIPQEDPEEKRLVELLRKRRLARLGEEPKHENPLPPTNNGRPWTLADILRSGQSRGSTSLPMKSALLKRLKRLEEVRAIESQPPVELQIGYVKKLPADYTGERHVVTVGRDADGTYRWKERRGAPPASEDGPKSIFRIFLVRAKDGRPDYSWPEDAQP